MMSTVPVSVSEASIISVVLDNLLLGDAVAAAIVELPIGQVDQLVDVLASQGCLAVQSSHRGPHLLEYHHVVF